MRGVADKSLTRRLASLSLPANPMKVVPFGEFLPDRASLGNPGSTEAKNVIPHTDGYEPFKAPVAVSSDALGARCQGAVGTRADSNENYIYAGTATALYRLGAALTHTDVKATTYSTPSDATWEFTRWGAGAGNKIIATNYADPVQIATVGSGNFANMMSSTETPKARHVSVVNNFVVLANVVSTADGTVKNRTHWSAINDETDFDPAAATQCDYQDQPTGGACGPIVGGENYGIQFQQEEIRRMSYVGGNRVFRFDVIDRQRGTLVPNSVVALGRNVFFWSEEGVFVTDGQQSFPIGEDRVDKWLLDQFDATNAHFVSSAVDNINKIVAWAFPGNGSSGTANLLLLYNWADKRFSYVETTCEFLIRGLRGFGYTLDSLATIGTNIDSSTLFPYSFDSSVYSGGSSKFGCYDASHYVSNFAGDNLEAVLDTQDFQPHSGLSDVTGIVPLVNGVETADMASLATAQMASRFRLADAVTYGSASTQNAFGKCTFAVNGKYHRSRITIPAGAEWREAQGVQIEASPGGTP